jgi:thiol:disulfide interchange protein DsbC
MKKSLTLLALLFATTTAFSQNIDLKNSLQKKFPNTKITSAEYIVEVPGLVELIVDRNKVIYTNMDGSLFLIGHICDTKTGGDITQQRINGLASINYSDLPFQDSIKVVKGNGAREFAVFSDPACPYCRKLEGELAKMDNYTMHVFPSTFKSAGKKIMARIYCEANPAKAWTDFMQKGVQPSSNEQCGVDKITRTVKLATEIGVSGTPALIAKNGTVRPGYAPAAQIEAWLNANSK